MSRGVSERVNRGVRGSVWGSVSGVLRAPDPRVSKRCPESVSGVSKGVRTLWRHSRDTFWTLWGSVSGAGRAPETLPQTLPRSKQSRKGRRGLIKGVNRHSLSLGGTGCQGRSKSGVVERGFKIGPFSLAKKWAFCKQLFSSQAQDSYKL